MGGGIRPQQQRGPWLGGAHVPTPFDPTKIQNGEFTSRQVTTDGAVEIGSYHGFVMDYLNAQPAYFTGKPILTSLDWSYIMGVGLYCSAANNLTDAFRTGIPGDFDFYMRFTLATAAQTGLVVTGGGQIASFIWDNTPQLTVSFTGQPDIVIPFAGSTVFLRIARNSRPIRFLYRVGGAQPWIQVAEYQQLMGFSAIASLRSGIGAAIAEFITSEGIPEIRAENVGTGAGLVVRDVTQAIVNVKTIKAGTGIGVANNADDITLTATGSEATSVVNVGTGLGKVYKSMTGAQINLKSILAGTGITVADGTDDVTVTNSAPESTSVTMVGTGLGKVYKSMTGAAINIKSILAGTGITVANGTDDVTVTNSAPESTSVTMVGTGLGKVYKSMTGAAINIKSILAGTGITVADGTDDVTVTNSAPEATTVANVGTGVGKVYKSMSTAQINLKSILAGNGMTVANGTDDVTVTLGAGFVALTDDATITVDAATGNKFVVTLGGNRTLGAPSNPVADGQLILFRIIQDGTGGRTLAYNAIYRFSTDIPSPTLSTGINKIDYLGFVYNTASTKWDCIGKVFGF